MILKLYLFLLNIWIVLVNKVYTGPLPFSLEDVTVIPYPPSLPIAGGYIPNTNGTRSNEYVQISGNGYYNERLMLSLVKGFPKFNLYSYHNKMNKQVWVFASEEKVIAYRIENLDILDPLHLGSIWQLSLSPSYIQPIHIQFVYPSCMNSVKDNNEEGVDCGGTCRPCEEFSSCMTAPKITYKNGHKILNFSTCTGLLKHGEYCEKGCPPGYRMKSDALLNMDIYSQCYDGKLRPLSLSNHRNKIGNSNTKTRDLSMASVTFMNEESLNINNMCESPFEYSCKYLEIKSMSNQIPLKKLDCEGIFTSIPRSNKQKTYWTSLDINGDRLVLFWRENTWVCINTKKNEVLGYMYDTNPVQLTSIGNHNTLVWVSDLSKTTKGSPETTLVELKCSSVKQIKDANSCDNISMQGWSIGATLNGIWSAVGTLADRFNGDIRPIYIKPYSSLVMLYNSYKLQWEIHKRHETSVIKGNSLDLFASLRSNSILYSGWILVAVNFNDSTIPPTGRWILTADQSHSESEYNQGINKDLSSSYSIVDVYCKSDNKNSKHSQSSMRISAIKQKPVICSRKSPIISFVPNIDLSKLFFVPKIIPKGEFHIDEDDCPYIEIIGTSIEAISCSGVFKLQKLNGKLSIWTKIESNGEIRLFYWIGTKWICTRNDSTNSIIGFIEDSRMSQGSWLNKLDTKNGAYINTITRVKCLQETKFAENMSKKESTQSSNLCNIGVMDNWPKQLSILNGKWNLQKIQIDYNKLNQKEIDITSLNITKRSSDNEISNKQVSNYLNNTKTINHQGNKVQYNYYYYYYTHHDKTDCIWYLYFDNTAGIWVITDNISQIKSMESEVGEYSQSKSGKNTELNEQELNIVAFNTNRYITPFNKGQDGHFVEWLSILTQDFSNIQERLSNGDFVTSSLSKVLSNLPIHVRCDDNNINQDINKHHTNNLENKHASNSTLGVRNRPKRVTIGSSIRRLQESSGFGNLCNSYNITGFKDPLSVFNGIWKKVPIDGSNSNSGAFSDSDSNTHILELYEYTKSIDSPIYIYYADAPLNKTGWFLDYDLKPLNGFIALGGGDLEVKNFPEIWRLWDMTQKKWMSMDLIVKCNKAESSRLMNSRNNGLVGTFQDTAISSSSNRVKTSFTTKDSRNIYATNSNELEFIEDNPYLELNTDLDDNIQPLSEIESNVHGAPVRQLPIPFMSSLPVIGELASEAIPEIENIAKTFIPKKFNNGNSADVNETNNSPAPAILPNFDQFSTEGQEELRQKQVQEGFEEGYQQAMQQNSFMPQTQSQPLQYGPNNFDQGNFPIQVPGQGLSPQIYNNQAGIPTQIPNQ
ncbi:hypothetical protein ACR3K2_31210, partial [Cryptosporidium serpentis]